MWRTTRYRNEVVVERHECHGVARSHVETVEPGRRNIGREFAHHAADGAGELERNRLGAGEVATIPVHLRERENLAADHISGGVAVMLDDLQRQRRSSAWICAEGGHIADR